MDSAELSSGAWLSAGRKSRRFRGVEDLAPGESLAQHMVARAHRAGKLRELFDELDDGQVEQLVWDLDFWARPEQIPPENFEWCVALAGRGFGKTWMGSRWVNLKAREGKTLGALIGQTAADVRDTMIRGSSGILALAPPWFKPIYEPSKRRVTWPNGIYAICYSADKPDSLRGPNTGWVWGDEPASWRDEMAALDQIPLFNRIGTKARPPQVLLTGTPRPLKKLEALIEKPGTVLRTGSSLANAANLAPSTVREMRAMANTRWGQQEILGRLLMDVPGAIFGKAKWTRIDADPIGYARTLERRVVAVDPAPTSETGADETGIVALGVRHVNGLRVAAVLEDRTLRGSPREWATAAIKAYLAYEADALVVEVNSGGEMVEETISTVAGEMGIAIHVKPVRAREAKSKRAEPVSALAEAGRIEIVGNPEKLLRQLEKFTGINGRRDDRADAMCWGIHDLVFGEQFWTI